MSDPLGDRLDRYMTLLAFWPITGAILDSRYHATGGAETFWTLRHAIVYSGVAALLLMLVYTAYCGWKRQDEDGSLMDILPSGYNMAVLGILLISIGGFGDMIWHTLFGVEQGGLELGSPSHLLLGVGALILAATPLRRAWYGEPGSGWREQFPMLTSASFTLTILSYLIYSVHPLVRPYFPAWSGWSALELAPLTGATGMVLYTMFLTALFLHLINRFDVVPGGFTYIIGLSALLMTVPYGLFIFLPAALFTGVVADTFRLTLSPTWDRDHALRAYAVIVPMTFSLSYVATTFLTGGTPWNIHQWTSLLVLPGLTGAIVSYGLQPTNRDKETRN